MKTAGHTPGTPGIDDDFKKIVGTAPPAGFGEPFITAFKKLYNGKPDEISAAAYTCSLFLSAIFEEFPTTTLHTFVHYIQENYKRFSFNCKMYEHIFKEMNTDTPQAVSLCLLSNTNLHTTRKCSKEDIFEAFDFYTNR